MADFDAGSIEGRLDLDTDPFIRGLREAKAEATAFERTTEINVRANVTGIGDSDATSTIDVDSAGADAAIARTTAELEALDHKKAEPKVDVDTRRANAALMALDRNVDKIAGAYKRNSNPLSGGGGGHGMAYLLGLAASLAPAFGPATAAIGLFGAAGVAAFGGMAVSMGLWGKIVGGVFKQIQQANKEGKTLTGSLGQLQTALKGLSGAWSDLQTKAGPGIAKALLPTFQTLEHLLPKLLPLINAISTGVGGALIPIDNLLKSKRFDHFIDLLSSNAVKDLPQVGSALAHILGGLMGVFTALNPLIQLGLPILVKMTREFDKWSRSGAGDFVHDVFDTIQTYGPMTLHMLHNLFGALGNIAKGFAPLTGPALMFLSNLFFTIKNLNLKPLTSAIGDLLDKLDPFVTVLGEIVNTLLPPFAAILGTLADNFVGPLGESLAQELSPALDSLAGLLDRLAEPLGLFLSSIADLVNPTGVGLLSTLISDLVGPVGDLLVPLINLATTLEGVVDDFLEAVAPTAIPVLTGLMQGLADIVGPLADGLSAFLGYGPIGPILLGIAVGIKATILAVKGYEAVAAFVGVLRTILALSAAEGIMAGIAAVSPALAGGITAVGVAFDFLLGPVGLVILAVAAFAAVAFLIYKNWGPISHFFSKMWDGIKHGFMAAVHWAGDLAGKIGSAISDAFTVTLDWVKKHWDILAIIVAPFLIMPIELAKHWGPVSDFLGSIPGKVRSIFSSAGSWIVGAGRGMMRGLWNGVKWGWKYLLFGWLFNRRKETIAAIGNAEAWLLDKGRAVISGMWRGLKDRWESVKGWFQSRAGVVVGWLAGAKDWLVDAGKAILQGLWDGMKSKWEDVKNWVGGIGGWIGDHKGPLDYDRVLLVPHGKAIMAGLDEGLTTGFVKVQHNVSGMADTLANGFQPKIGVKVTATRETDPAEMYALSQKESMDQLIAVLTGLADGLKAMSKEDRDAMVAALVKAYTAAGTAQTRQIITAVKKQ